MRQSRFTINNEDETTMFYIELQSHDGKLEVAENWFQNKGLTSLGIAVAIHNFGGCQRHPKHRQKLPRSASFSTHVPILSI